MNTSAPFIEDRLLVPHEAFRDRLNARLNLAGVPDHARTAYVAALTDRAPQTVSRWLDPDRPGLPDMESCARLCRALPCSADWLMGLVQQAARRTSALSMRSPGTIPQAEPSALDLLGDLILSFQDCEPMRMAGDEMAPRIRDGDMLFVNSACDRLSGNGIYVLEFDGRVLVRDVENRIGAGLVFRCANPHYKESTVRDFAAAERIGLRVLGLVVGTIAAVRFHGA